MNEIHGLNSAIVHYGSSLHKREENFDNVSFESSKPTVVHHWQGSQDSNNVETKDKPSSVLRDTDVSTMPEIPASSKSKAAAAAILLC